LRCDALTPDRVHEIQSAIKSKYRAVAQQPEGNFSYPVGRESALKLGYAPKWFQALPVEIVNRFVGVGNPFQIHMPQHGDRVLDVGCGCGFDTFVAAFLVGDQGRATGIDLSPEMLFWPRTNATLSTNPNAEFLEGSAEILPFKSATFDLVISNGALNLVLDKAAAFSEISRILRPGGIFASADLLVIETIPPEILSNTDAWST